MEPSGDRVAVAVGEGVNSQNAMPIPLGFGSLLPGHRLLGGGDVAIDSLPDRFL